MNSFLRQRGKQKEREREREREERGERGREETEKACSPTFDIFSSSSLRMWIPDDVVRITVTRLKILPDATPLKFTKWAVSLVLNRFSKFCSVVSVKNNG